MVTYFTSNLTRLLTLTVSRCPVITFLTLGTVSYIKPTLSVYTSSTVCWTFIPAAVTMVTVLTVAATMTRIIGWTACVATWTHLCIVALCSWLTFILQICKSNEYVTYLKYRSILNVESSRCPAFNCKRSNI